MNKNIRALTDLASKKERHIIGLMSGTSLDGLDVVLCRVTGSGFETKVVTEQFQTISYSPEIKQQLRSICFQEHISLAALTNMHRSLGLLHAEMINDCLSTWKIKSEHVDLIASHGQTVYHAPADKCTLQIGDADQIAYHTGIITISDFRQKNIAAGGEGAPLAGYGDLLLFAKKNKNVFIINIGGISNLTFIGKNGAFICTDIGPGNTIMDAQMHRNDTSLFYDKSGSVAAGGQVNEKLLSALKTNAFLKKQLPKSTGPELFNLQYLDAALSSSGTTGISNADIMASLSRFTAEAIIELVKSLCEKDSLIYFSGGGLSNNYLMRSLKSGLTNHEIRSTNEKGIDPDAKEAILFALLANECIAGDADIFKNYPCLLPVSAGKISFPY